MLEAKHTEKKKTKVLIRIRSNGLHSSYSYRKTIMKRGIFYKVSPDIARLLLQRKNRLDEPIFEVCSLKRAYELCRNESRDPAFMMQASSIPEYFGSLVDLEETEKTKANIRRNNSYAGLLQEAQNGDLLLSAEDEEMLESAIVDGQPFGMAMSQAEKRIKNLENLLSKLVHAKDIEEQEASQRNSGKKRGRPRKPVTEDHFDVELIEPDEEKKPIKYSSLEEANKDILSDEFSIKDLEGSDQSISVLSNEMEIARLKREAKAAKHRETKQKNKLEKQAAHRTAVENKQPLPQANTPAPEKSQEVIKIDNTVPTPRTRKRTVPKLE